MRYLSTRDKLVRVTAAEAIAKGLSDDGGLFVPEVLPSLSEGQIQSMCAMRYQQRAVYIMSAFLKDFSAAELTNFAAESYNDENFSVPQIAPLKTLTDDTWFLELWHGPTSAFKDMALQMLPHLLTASLQKTGESREVCILVATSGDTGKAALEGFCDVDRTKILVFYPQDGVSDVQKLQMVSQSGGNVGVCGVAGNFDDAQTGVKQIFGDPVLKQVFSAAGYVLSSANSINWGRLLPQIVYYVSAYCDLVQAGRIALGGPVNVSVPTGNFGNILAAFYAKRMGLPINKLICASNENNVLTNFIRTGTYDRNRPFHNTLSPSMDILVSSNLERLLFALSGESDTITAAYMAELNKTGRYTVTPQIKREIDQIFWADYCDDEKTKKVIYATYRKYGYLIDPHTAVAFDVLNHYRHDTGDNIPAIVVSTASPYKFADSVLDALGQRGSEEGMELIDRLASVTGTVPPMPLMGLKGKRVRFDQVIYKEAMPQAVMDFLR